MNEELENKEQVSHPAAENVTPEAVAPEPETVPAAEEPKEEKPKQKKPRAKKEEASPKADQPAEAIEEPVEAAEQGAEETEKSGKRWYVVQTYSGQEDKVKESIEFNVKQMNMGHKISQIIVPTEDTVEIRDGKRIEKIKKMFPGYVFIEMILDDESWYVIRGTPGVAKFIGTKVMPTPVSDKEMQRVLKQIGVKAERLEISFDKGEAVRIISGPFRGYTGSIDEVNPQKGKLKVLISIFGRDTPVEVKFEQVQRLV